MHLLHVAHHLGQRPAPSRDGHDRHLLVQQRDRPVLELARSVALSVDVRDLLQLQRTLEGDRKVDPAAHIQGVARVRVPPADVRELCLEHQRALNQRGHTLQLRDQPRVLVDVERASHIAEMQRQQDAARHLIHERLGGGDRDLRPRVHVEDAVRLHGERTADHVGDGENRRPTAARVADRGERVGGFSRLRERHHERFAVYDSVGVAELARRLHRAAHPRDVLDGIARHHRGVPRRSARNDDHLAHPRQHIVGNADLAQIHRTRVRDPAAKHVAECLRLLMNLLQKKVRIAILLSLIRFPVDGDHPRLDGDATEGLHVDARRSDAHDLTFAQQRDTLGVLDERGDVAAHEHLTVP